MKQVKTRRVIKDKPAEEEEEEVGDMNDISCVDCGRQYPLVDGASNCRCKRCNTLFKTNQNKKFAHSAKKI